MLPVEIKNPTIVWGPSQRWPAEALSRPAEIWRYRDLLSSLVWRDVKLRYRGTVFGFVWCLLNPLLMTLIFTLLFTVFMSSNTIPHFPAFALIGVLVWNFHATSILGAIQSVTGNGALLSKTYFPREILPLSAVLSSSVNFLLTLPVLLVFLFLSGIAFEWSLLLFPVAFAVQLTFLCGFSLFLSTLNVFYRDTGIIMETLMLAWFFLTPVFYLPQNLFPEWQRALYLVNPAASVLAIYRDALYSGSFPDPLFLVRSTVQALAFLAVGSVVFQRFADRFVEEL